LVAALGEAHHQSSYRACPSTVAVSATAQGSGDIYRSLAAALLCFGGKHGPIEQTYTLLQWAEDVDVTAESIVGSYISRKQKVPGWGSSFTEEGEADPIWKPVDAVLMKHFEERRWTMTKITQALHEAGVKVLPNPSAYTALTAIILKMPKRLAPYLLITGRLSAWTEIFMGETKGQ
jgi:citrate synthase